MSGLTSVGTENRGLLRALVTQVWEGLAGASRLPFAHWASVHLAGPVESVAHKGEPPGGAHRTVSRDGHCFVTFNPVDQDHDFVSTHS